MPKKPDRLKIGGNWEDAAAKAVNASKPNGGWPKPPSVPQRAKKSTKKK